MRRVFTYLGRKQYSINTAPSSKVNEANHEEIHNFQYSDSESYDNFIEFKLRIGDYVRKNI